MRTMLPALVLFLAQAGPGTGSLVGVVVNSGSNEPIARASVLIVKLGGTPDDAQTVTTSAGGEFHIRNILVGRYSIIVTHAGFARFVYGQTAANNPAGAVDIAAGQEVKDIVIKMTPTGVIAGRVFNADGEPAAEVSVRAQKGVYREGLRSMTTVKEVVTNDLGEYRLSGLLPGQYFVSASPPQGARIEGNTFLQPTPATAEGTPAGTASMAFQTAVSSGRVDPAVIAGDVYSVVYFPGTTDPAAATPIVLRAGATVGAVDLKTIRMRQARIRGRVINSATGQPAQSLMVALNPTGRQTLFSFRTARVSNMGDFEFTGLVPGSYILTASIQNTEPRMSAVTPVELATANLDTVLLVLRPLFNLAGRASIEGRVANGNDPDLPRMRLVLRPKLTAGGPTANVGADGAFTFSGTSAVSPGDEYQLSLIELLAPRKNFYIKSARLGAIDVLNTDLHLDRESSAPLEVVLSPNSAIFDGVAVDERLSPIPGVTVVLVPDVAHRRRTDLYKTATTDPSGRVHIEGIVPGNYKSFAWQEVETGAWQDPEFLRLYETRGQPIHFDEKTEQTATLKLIP